MKYLIYFSGLLSFFFISCKKEEIVAKTEENTSVFMLDTVVILGNIPPADTGYSQLQVDNFISKTYITLIGRKPNDAELIISQNLVSPTQFSVTQRKLFIDEVLSHTGEYYSKLFSEQSAQLIQNTDSNDINSSIYTYQFILSNGSYQDYWPMAQYQLDRLLTLKNTYYQCLQGLVSLPEIHKSLINNVFYDDINMGTANFVTSSFLSFFNRYPTNSELQEASLMVDGFNGILFYQIGDSKEDYLDIFFASDSYFEGQVQDVYVGYIGQQPHAQVLANLTTLYKNTGDYESLLKEILSRDEFAY